jgi:hypothetical protein
MFRRRDVERAVDDEQQKILSRQRTEPKETVR